MNVNWKNFGHGGKRDAASDFVELCNDRSKAPSTLRSAGAI